MTSVIGLLIYLLVVAVAGFALFWVIRLGVRFGLRDHAKWTQTGAASLPE